MQTAIKERPIRFKDPMVRAILEGRKTQTRRVVKGLPEGSFTGPCLYEPAKFDRNGEMYPGPEIFGIYGDDWGINCPYGKPGDRLWVRERWRVAAWHEGEPILIEYEDGTHCEESGSDADYYGSWYERMMEQSADDCARAGLKPDDDGIYNMNESGVVTRWRPSLFMPRWASRITLEITNVRVERVQDISSADAIAEGAVPDDRMTGDSYIKAYARLWDTINGKKYPWASRPWVWVIEFKRVEN